MNEQNQQQQIQLAPGELLQLEQVSLTYDARIPKDVNPEELANPAFWANYAVKLRPFDEIRARCEDGTWMASFVVLEASRTWARVKLLQMYKLTSGDVALTQTVEAEVQSFKAKHVVTYRGPNMKWSVVRTSDKAVLTEGIEAKDTAIAWLEAHARGEAAVLAPKVPATA